MYSFRVFLSVVGIEFIVVLSLMPAQDAINLEDSAQDFVLETEQIKISEYPYAFNPSIVRWQGSLLLSFRTIPNPRQWFTSCIGLVWLDEHFKPISEPQILMLRDADTTVPSRIDDGRLIVVGDHLYLIYSDNEEPVISKGGFRMYIAEIGFSDSFYIKHKERITTFEGNNISRREKNWVPFEYKRELLLAYSIIPHRILKPLLGTHHAETVATSAHAFSWNWGEIRGGTPGLLHKDHYLAFFHSSKRMMTEHSKERNILHYFIGAYLFSAKYPFQVTHMSAEPIIGKKFYIGPEYKPYWYPAQVVFPCGFIHNDTYIWIVYGRQDHEMWVAKLDKKKLYEHLIPVSTVRFNDKTDVLVFQ